MKIIFKNRDGSIGIITPTNEALAFATIEEIAEKDVPAPYQYPVSWTTVDVTNPNTGLVVQQAQPTEYATYETPYWIVDVSVIPSDRTLRNAWEVDEAALGQPYGFGGANNAFPDRVIKKMLEQQA